MEKANIGFKAGIIFEKLGETGLITKVSHPNK